MLSVTRSRSLILLQIFVLILGVLAPLSATAAPVPTLVWAWVGTYTAFYETLDNTGQMLNSSNYLTVSLQDGGSKTFALANGTEMIAGTHYKLDGTLPEGVILRVLQTDPTHVKIYLDGYAVRHSSADNVEGLKITFLGKAFSDGSVGTVLNPGMNGLAVHFYNGTLVFAPNPMYFVESANNDGSIDPSTVLAITLNGSETFVEEEFVEGVHFNTHHIPAGLTAKITRINNTRLQLSLQGNATRHDTEDSDTMEIEFTNAAYVSGDASQVVVANPPIINVSFSNPKTLSWSTTDFLEGAANDGSIETVISLSLTGDNPETFSGPVGVIGADTYRAENIPAGLTIQINKIDETHAEIRLTGKATEHQAANSVANLSVAFRNAAFTGGDAGAVAGSSRTGIKVTFKDNETTPENPPASQPIVATFTLDRQSYQVNGVSYPMDATPYIANDRTYVPVRYLGYSLGLKDDEIVWDAPSQRVFLSHGGTTVFLQLGNTYINVNGKSQNMNVVPESKDGRIYLPARFVAEAFGAKVEWVQESSTVIISRQ